MMNPRNRWTQAILTSILLSTGSVTLAFASGDLEVWVEGGPHGNHYAFGPGYDAKGGFLGVQLTELTPELRTHFGVGEDVGVLVAKVIDDSAAFRAGLEVGDIITRIEDKEVSSARDLMRAVSSREEGEFVGLEVWRQGSYQNFTATLGQQTGLWHFSRQVGIDCDEGQEDCGLRFIGKTHRSIDNDCPDDEACEVEIRCHEGDCECAINGDPVDCEGLPGECEPGR